MENNYGMKLKIISCIEVLIVCAALTWILHFANFSPPDKGSENDDLFICLVASFSEKLSYFEGMWLSVNILL